MVQIVKVLVVVGAVVPAFAAPINFERPKLDAREPEPMISPSTLIKAGKMGYKLFSGVSLAASFAPLFHHHHKNKNQPRELAEDVQLEIREPIWFPNMAEIKAFGKFLKMAGKKAKGGVEFGATVAPFIPHLGKKKQKQANHRRALEELERREPTPVKSLRLPHVTLPHFHFKLPHLHIPHMKLPHITRGRMAKIGGGAAAVAGFGGIITASQLENRDFADSRYKVATREDDVFDSYLREYDAEEFYTREDEEDMYSRDYDDALVEAREWEFDVNLREVSGFDELD